MKTEQNTTVAPRPPELFHAAPMAGALSQRPEIITASASPGPPPEVKVAARKLRVLVVQDDPSDVELVLHALKRTKEARDILLPIVDRLDSHLEPKPTT